MENLDPIKSEPYVVAQITPAKEGHSPLKMMTVIAIGAMLIAAPLLAVIAIPLSSRGLRNPTLGDDRVTFVYPPEGSSLAQTEWIETCPLVPTALYQQTVAYAENPACEGIVPPDVDAPPQQILQSHYNDCRSLSRRLVDRMYAIKNEVMGGLSRIPSLMQRKLGFQHPHYIDPLLPLPQWKVKSEALYVMVHGLKSDPSTWDTYSEELDHTHAKADQALILVPKGGNCRVREAAKPIVALIEDYIKKYPNNPISLIGTSNGARIVAFIELYLRTSAPKTPVQVSTVAGAHFGSQVMNYVHQFGVSKLLGYTPEIIEELSYGSDVVQTTLDAQRQALPEGLKRDYRFYMTTEETHVQPSTSELAIISQGEKHFVVHGEGHASIVQRVRPHLLEHAAAWLHQHKLKE